MANGLLQSVDNALQIMEVFSEESAELGVSEISKRMGLGKSTVHRLLATMEKRGFVEQNPGTTKYRLGIKIVHLGAGVLRQLNIIRESRPHIKKLSHITGESAHLALYSQGEITFVEKVTGKNPAKMGSTIGVKLPAYCTATGKVLLSFLPDAEREETLAKNRLKRFTPHTILDIDLLRQELIQIKSLGYAEDQQEADEGLVCFAAPIKNIACEVIAAISVSGAASRMNDRKNEFIPLVRDAADMISRACGCPNIERR